MVTYKSKHAQKATTSDGVELEALRELHIGGLEDVYLKGVLRTAKEVHSTILQKVLRKVSFKSNEAPRTYGQLEMDKELARKRKKNYITRLAKQPPNLILNVHNALPDDRELWVFAIVGVVLQFVAIAIPVVMTYHWKRLKGTKQIQDYAFPTFLIGTCFLSVGIALCSYVIDATTVEHVFTPTDGYEVNDIFRLQFRQEMGDQPFNAYVIVNNPEDKKIRVSRYNPEEIPEAYVLDDLIDETQQDIPNAVFATSRTSLWSRITRCVSKVTEKISRGFAKPPPKSKSDAQEPTVILAVILCSAGFICQFVGLRALHWTAAVTQLGVTILMTCIRAWVRRGISNHPTTFKMHKTDPNWIALSLGTACQQRAWPSKGAPWPAEYPTLQPYSLVERSPHSAVPITIEDTRIKLRQKLQTLVSEVDVDLVPISEGISEAFGQLRFQVYSPTNHGDITWVHVIESISGGANRHRIEFARLTLRMVDGNVDKNELHALLALWTYQAIPSAPYRCVARVFSDDDWIEKRDFLRARLESTHVSCFFLPAGGHALGQSKADNERLRYIRRARSHRRYTGLSIENMQGSDWFSAAGQNQLFGYLVVRSPNPSTRYPAELLSGFMDALWRSGNVKYNDEVKGWYSDGRRRSTLNIDYVANILVRWKLVRTENEAKILVVSSLARCTVWRNPPNSDDPIPTADEHPEPHSPTVVTTLDGSPQQESSRLLAFETAQANEIPQTGAETPNKSTDQPTSAPSIPILGIFATQTEQSSDTSAIIAETSVTHHTPEPNTPVLSAYEDVQSNTDKGKRAATSNIPEPQITSTARSVARGVTAPESGESSQT